MRKKDSNLDITRDPEDRRDVTLQWEKSDNATGYNISFGVNKNKLYHNYIVYNNTKLEIDSLNAGQAYYFSIESFNENGITPGEMIISVD